MEFILYFIIGFIIAAVLCGVAVYLLRSKLAGGSAELVAEYKTRNEELQAKLDEAEDKITEVSQDKVRAETRLEEATKSFEQSKAEQQKLLTQAHQQLTDTFNSLAGKALKSNNESFMTLAKQALESSLKSAKTDLDKRQESIKTMVNPLNEILKKYEAQLQQMEKHRAGAYSALTEQVKNLMAQQQELRKETGNLVTALRRPQVRGRWGEITLRRVAELAGMVEHCDFDEQVAGEAVRPDMVVHLPAGREIIVDSKVSLDAYLSAIEAGDDDHKQAQLTRHANQLKEHMRQLAGKSYWDKFAGSAEFVVMFVPLESSLAAAIEKYPNIIEDGMKDKVVIATPTTLVALMRAVAYGWRQEQLAENARKISSLGMEMHDRLRVLMTHIVNMGRSLNKTNEAYNKTVGTLEARVMPSARKFKELGAAGAGEIPELEKIEVTTRQLSAEDNDDEQLTIDN